MSRASSKDTDLFQIGLYSIGEAARLARVPTATIRRWLAGYDYPLAKGKGHQPAVWTSELPQEGPTRALSFNDLLEIRFVHEFRKAGIKLSAIRKAISELREMVGTRYPFSNQRIFTDGKVLFTKIHDDEGKPLFLELSGTKQTAIYNVILQHLKRGLIFEENRVTRWYPDKDKYKAIIIDPRVLFGHPAIEGTRLDVETLVAAYQAEESYERVADWYGVEMNAVKEAVSFHQQYLAA